MDNAPPGDNTRATAPQCLISGLAQLTLPQSLTTSGHKPGDEIDGSVGGLDVDLIDNTAGGLDANEFSR